MSILALIQLCARCGYRKMHVKRWHHKTGYAWGLDCVKLSDKYLSINIVTWVRKVWPELQLIIEVIGKLIVHN